MSESLGTDYTRVNPQQSAYDPCIKSPCKVSSIVLGIILIIAGAVAAGTLYSQLGDVSLSCLSGVAIGIVLIILGARSTETIDTIDKPEEVTLTDDEPIVETHTLSITPYSDKLLTFTNSSGLTAGLYTIDRPKGDPIAIFIGEMQEESKLGPTAPPIVCFEAESEDENPHHKTMGHALNQLFLPSDILLYKREGLLKLQFTYWDCHIIWNVFLNNYEEDDSGQKFVILRDPALQPKY